MRSSTRLLSGLLAVLALAGPAVAQTAITPGYWESTNKLLSPIRQTTVEKRCITPGRRRQVHGGPSNRHYTCTYPTREIQDGKITLKGSCVSKKGQKVAITGSGTYTKTSFQLTADVAVEVFGLDIAGKASTEARRIGDVCPTPDPAG